MLVELLLLGLIITGLTYMATRTKANNITFDGLNIDNLVDKLAKAIAKEIAKELNNKTLVNKDYYNTKEAIMNDINSSIQMDNSVIPMKIDTSKLESNIENLTKEEVTIDKDLEKNKTKLASLMKKKKE